MTSATPEDSTAPTPGSVLRFADERAVMDLGQFAMRAKRVSDTGIRLQVYGSPRPGAAPLLAQWVSVMHPRGLGDGVPHVVGLRTVPLKDAEGLDGLDRVDDLSAILERTARMIDGDAVDTELHLPPRPLGRVAWTAQTPPRGGWKPAVEVANTDLIRTAKEGVEAMREVLPTDPGEAVVAQARAAVWGQMLGDPALMPAGMAFAAHALGFLHPEGRSRLNLAGPWIRMDTPGGFVLAKPAATL